MYAQNHLENNRNRISHRNNCGGGLCAVCYRQGEVVDPRIPHCGVHNHTGGGASVQDHPTIKEVTCDLQKAYLTIRVSCKAEDR